MHHWIGAGMMIAGASVAAITFYVNGQGAGPGPVPFFCGCAAFFIGLLTWSF